jgi:hypothetical protein
MKTFTVDDQTEITTQVAQKQHEAAKPGEERPGSEHAMRSSGGEKLELKDLKEGQEVTVKYVESAGKNLAKSIEVQSKRKPTS